jgi:hypothetical protein
MMTEEKAKPRELTIAVRAYATPVKPTKKNAPGGGLKKPSRWTLVFDTETTVDHAQTLRLGVYHLYEARALREKGIFFDPNPRSDTILKSVDIALIKAYAEEKGFLIRTTPEFVDKLFYRYGYHYGGSIVCFNAPFDFSRVALESDSARGDKMRGGFTFKLRPEKANPNVRVKHLSARASLIDFAAPPKARAGRSSRKRKQKTAARRGYFVDVKTLAATLTGASHSLETLAEHLGIQAKLNVKRHGGSIKRKYFDYAVRDVEVTAEAYFKLLDLFAAYGLTGTGAHQLYSEASLGKGHLREMGIRPLSEMQPDVALSLYGLIMSSYYGGRSEVAIRRTLARVVYCDFRSMYPTVCTLMGLWRFVIAKGFNYRDATEEAIALLEKADRATLLKRGFWPALTILVKVKADGDLFPTRAKYNGITRSIGLNPLTSDEPLWFTLADLIVAKLLSHDDPKQQRSPAILEAIRFEPREPQEGLKAIELQGSDRAIDPYTCDFFREVILLRGKVESLAKKEQDPLRKQQLKALAKNLKLIANSTSYGIFAEVNVTQHARLQDLLCYGPNAEPVNEQTRSIEKPGTYFHPLLATLITGAARLMLAIAERLVIDEGLDWAICDTDSMAIARPDGMSEAVFVEKVQRIRGKIAKLDPYGDGKDLLKIEDANFDPADKEKKTLVALQCLAISAKRYVLFYIGNDGKPVICKASAHGLGHLRPPFEEKDAAAHLPKPKIPLKDIGVDHWQHDLWMKIIESELAGHPDRVDLSGLPNMDEPAISRYSASTPDLLGWFKDFNEGKDWNEQVKPFNFLVAFQISPAGRAKAIADGTFDQDWLKKDGPSPVAPFDKDPRKAAKKCFDRMTGKPVPKHLLATYREALSDYHLHAEAKFLNAEPFDRGHTIRQPVKATAVELIGKEANRWEEQFFLGEDEDAQISYGLLPSSDNFHGRLSRFIEQFGVARVAEAAGVSRRSLTRLHKWKAPPTKRMREKLEESFLVLASQEARGQTEKRKPP